MRRLCFFYLLVWLILSASVSVNTADAQMPQRSTNQVAVIGWTDDSHYQIRNFDPDNKPVIQSVDIKTGKGVVIPSIESERDILVKARSEERRVGKECRS